MAINHDAASELAEGPSKVTRHLEAVPDLAEDPNRSLFKYGLPDPNGMSGIAALAKGLNISEALARDGAQADQLANEMANIGRIGLS